MVLWFILELLTPFVMRDVQDTPKPKSIARLSMPSARMPEKKELHVSAHKVPSRALGMASPFAANNPEAGDKEQARFVRSPELKVRKDLLASGAIFPRNQNATAGGLSAAQGARESSHGRPVQDGRARA